MTIWFTADTHLGHANIIQYCERPFQTTKEMDETIIENWNKLVKENDSIYHLGDFCFPSRESSIHHYLSKLNGKKFLVIGNHDKQTEIAKSVGGNSGWTNVNFSSLLDTNIHNQSMTLCHYCMRVWNKSHYGAWHLFGHSHGKVKVDNSRCIDVGVDNWKFSPVSFDELKEIMDLRTENIITKD